MPWISEDVGMAPRLSVVEEGGGGVPAAEWVRPAAAAENIPVGK